MVLDPSGLKLYRPAGCHFIHDRSLSTTSGPHLRPHVYRKADDDELDSGNGKEQWAFNRVCFNVVD